MNNLEISISDINQVPDAAKSILHFAGNARVFAFYGEMGTGKTTLIKEICKQLGSHDNFSSPTYSIVNEYELIGKARIYHIDCYRLKDIEEALAIGMEEYITSGNHCFIEWPELIEPLLPADVIKISLRADGNIRNIAIFRD